MRGREYKYGRSGAAPAQAAAAPGASRAGGSPRLREPRDQPPHGLPTGASAFILASNPHFFPELRPSCLPGAGEGERAPMRRAPGSAAALSGRASVDRSGAGRKGNSGVDERALEGSFVCCMHGLCGVPSTGGRPCKDGLKQSAVLRFGKKLLRFHSLCLTAVVCRWLYAKAFFCRKGSG